MLNAKQLEEVKTFLNKFSAEQRLWLSGFILGMHQTEPMAAPVGETATYTGKVTIAYGTETGNSKKIATRLAAQARQKKITAQVVSLEQYPAERLETEKIFLIIISTHGDGEPPAAAKKFYESLLSGRHQLQNLQYAVLALGDSAYPQFCKAGVEVDMKLKQFGAKPILPRKDCDADYETDANAWIDSVLLKISGSQIPTVPVTTQAEPTVASKPSGKKFYSGKVIANINLNDIGSRKQTHHIEIQPNEPVEFEPGDSVGLVPPNAEEEVQSVLRELKTIGSEFVTYQDKRFTFYQLLKSTLNIRQIQPRTISKYATQESIEISLNGETTLWQLFKKFPPKKLSGNWQAISDMLEPIAPRLYSIASSGRAHNGQLHLCVARNTFLLQDKTMFGLASNYLLNLPLGHSLQFYIQKNESFRLPDDDKDIIMVGPGTGVAPFRSFVAERAVRGAAGRNWLFFGEQHFKTDFLYQTEWLNWLETGVLTRLDVAFSRDGDQRVYVQHKMLLHAREIYDWLENGATFYVCGSKFPMSVDVEKTLLQIIAEQSGKGSDFAATYLIDLKEQDRYLKDVY
jgi:sulfite reductase (NADPH) flavoprotein alpha-component